MKVASHTWWLKMPSPPFNLTSQCCYVWWIADIICYSSDLIWIAACSWRHWHNYSLAHRSTDHAQTNIRWSAATLSLMKGEEHWSSNYTSMHCILGSWQSHADNFSTYNPDIYNVKDKPWEGQSGQTFSHKEPVVTCQVSNSQDESPTTKQMIQNISYQFPSAKDPDVHAPVRQCWLVAFGRTTHYEADGFMLLLISV